jgi:CxxC motif-containing protein
MKKSLICISCPLGCSLDVVYEPNKIVSVDGATCKRGQTYAEKEIFDPERVVTSTVKVVGASIDFLPVKTDTTVRKEMMTEVMKKVFEVKVKAPVKVGDIICKNIAESGANLVATRSLEAK